ncbi:MAG: putative toxin-antitoxin system toxin component, PIN family [Nitrospirae bacterium]|nr:putative toxin-antitoxin system toxin component, PIN family [Nitrospirota bacterium]
MLKVVLDTNIIVSAVAFGRLPANILERAVEGEFINITSDFILQEVETVLIKKFRWSIQDAQDVITLLLGFSELVQPQVQIVALDYPPDNHILECAIAGKADLIVTGDKKHLLPLKQYEGIRILSVGAFLDWINTVR